MPKEIVSMDPRCPPGYRHLLSLIEATSPLDARLELIAMFGEAKAKAAVIVQGHHQPKHLQHYGYRSGEWVFSQAGYTAFIPKGFRS